MDFKIGDEIEENGGSKAKKKDSNITLIIIVIGSIMVGLLVFFVSNSLFGKKDIPAVPATSQNLSLTDENVQILYNYVTYGTRNTRGDKFIKEKNVTLDSFTDAEKFYYALQFVDVEDFIATGKLTDDKKKIYLISNSNIKGYMQRFFGSRVTYSTDTVITYPFSFRINGQNVGIMTYSEVDEGFEVVFDGYEEDIEEELIKPYYTELVSATKEVDGSYVLKEKIVYTKVEKNSDNTYNISIYKDYENTSLIETKTNLTEESLVDGINMSNYSSNASVITYTFKVSGNTLYFDNSVITNS